MKVEIHSTAKFFEQFLEKRKAEELLKVKKFLHTLVVCLEDKFQNHWYPSQPSKGNAYRCIQSIGSKVDPIISKCMRAAQAEFTRNFPANLTVWIDPGEVSYKIGEFGSICALDLLREPTAFEDVELPTDFLDSLAANSTSPRASDTAPSSPRTPAQSPKMSTRIPSIAAIPQTPSNKIPDFGEALKAVLSLGLDTDMPPDATLQEREEDEEDEEEGRKEKRQSTSTELRKASVDQLGVPESPVRERDIPSPNPFRVWSAPRSRRARSAVNFLPEPPQFYSPPPKGRRASEMVPSPSRQTSLLSPASLRRFTPSFMNLPDVDETFASLRRTSNECLVSG